MIKQIRIHVQVLLVSLAAVSIAADAAPAKPTFTKVEKQRVIVLTDITNEPDDEQSMVRFLLAAGPNSA